MVAFADDSLNDEFDAACNDPQGFDFGFEKQRERDGYANFGFDPGKANEMRVKEQARINALEDDEDFPYDDDCDDDDDDSGWDSYADDEDDEDDYDDDDDFDDEDEDDDWN